MSVTINSFVFKCSVHKLKYQVIAKDLQTYKDNFDRVKSMTDASVLTEEAGIRQLAQTSSQTTFSYCGKKDVSTMTEITSTPTSAVAVTSYTPVSLRVHRESQTVDSMQSISSTKTSTGPLGRHKRSYSDSGQCHSARSVEPKRCDDVNAISPLKSRQDDEDGAAIGRKSENMGQHKCLWQKEMNRLQLKLRSLQKQVKCIFYKCVSF